MQTARININNKHKQRHTTLYIHTHSHTQHTPMELEKKSKEQLRRYKKSRHTHSSSESSSTDTESGSGSSYSSTDSEREREREREREHHAHAHAHGHQHGHVHNHAHAHGHPHTHTHPHQHQHAHPHQHTHQRGVERHHRKKKSSRRAASSSGDERQKREKRERERHNHGHGERDHDQKKLVAKRNHIKRKLKEARLKKRAAAALSGHGHRSLSPATQAKLKKMAERKQRERERDKLRGVHREHRDRERDHHRLGSSRSPTGGGVGSSSTTTTTKIRIHQDVLGKRQKSPGPGGSGSSMVALGVPTARMHHQLMSREKIIIQTRARVRTPSIERERERDRERERMERERERERHVEREQERQRHEHKLHRHDELSLRNRERDRREQERADREAARDKERAEALARCQERQRERERLAREKLRRQEEEESPNGGSVGKKSYGGSSVRELDLPMSYVHGSRERSLETVERSGRHVRDKRELDPYEREQDFIEPERHGLMDVDMRRYGGQRRRELSPLPEHYAPRVMRDPRDLYSEEERERAYKRAYLDARYSREREAWLEAREMRDYRELDNDEALVYADERERMLRERERERERMPARGDYRAEWERDWEDEGAVAGGAAGANGGGTPARSSGFVGGSKRSKQAHSSSKQQQHTPSEPEWDADEREECVDTGVVKSESGWQLASSNDWRDSEEPSFGCGRGNANEMHGAAHGMPSSNASPHHHMHGRSERGGGGGGGGRGFRRGGGGGMAHGHGHEQGERGYRSHPPPLMTLPVQPPGGYHGGGGGGGSRGFLHKRSYGGGGGYLKKHQHMGGNMVSSGGAANPAAQLKPGNAAAQASAVAAATTAVAAAKAAAQSSANATTNPGILAQVSKFTSIKQEDGSEDSTGTMEAVGGGMENCHGLDRELKQESKSNGELSEISDSDDDILNTTDRIKPKCESLLDADAQELSADALSNDEQQIKIEHKLEDKLEEMDEVLDFEEISDGELEEEARVQKGIGDALGVDWEGLVAETRQHAEEHAAARAADRNSSAKKLWQPHRVILELGISFDMAGVNYAHSVLNEARYYMMLEHKEQYRLEASLEPGQTPPPPLPHYSELLDTVYVAPMACDQLGLREIERQRQAGATCSLGMNALCARQDLRLRRQLFDLPTREIELSRNRPMISENLRSLAMIAFQQSLDVQGIVLYD
ncbi:fl(2)d-associated complex component [Drosophila busckii]|uniref:fl(2)d-associated complex component n=1 Tax=Drosophila busckii TaxID=30019 RepID=UPI0014333798|nr:fl(2)d-associated complex component [Drosophila busckii]